ncbi:MAG: LuxR C-terminal-related transcriptional regulator [Ruminococcus sp.]|uniref:LuxR C-terminal-related transcriptional regulator n=1 Tax=Ruminococcus sp. TaxID=41978 RepID=UPI0025E0EA97|nr:LuxR C-terminal-related transcriptional regulator [Ruminococcus sp.]MCR5539210.1 LuxR C-terminal-related transcriptional regulator [Ruminococcus sp.]
MDEIKEICRTYDKIGSIKGTATQLGISWNRITKVLSSNGYVLNDKHQRILELHKQGKSVQEIADSVKLSIKTVQSYIPAQRPFYKYKQSKNAQRIAQWRASKDENPG